MQHPMNLVMLALLYLADYDCAMSRESVVDDPLVFSDGDRNVRIHTNDTAPDTYLSASIGNDIISFTHLGDDCKPLPLPEDTNLVTSGISYNPLVPAAHTQYERESTESDWRRHSYLVPTISALREAKARLEPMGAHPSAIVLRHGDDPDGLFKVETMLEAVADGEFIISTSPPLYFHDAMQHGLGLVTLDSESVETLRALSKLAYTYMDSARNIGVTLANSLITGYDHATFFYNKPGRQGCAQLQSGRNDALLGYILKFAEGRLPSHAWAEVIRTVETGPFTYNIRNRMVRRYPAIADYYALIGELLASSKPASASSADSSAR